MSLKTMCLNKRLYITLAEAQKFQNRVLKKFKTSTRIYKCHSCMCYHLTTKLKILGGKDGRN